MVRCKECGKKLKTRELRIHLLCAHTMNREEYEVKHTHGGIWPLCSCGCEAVLPFNDRQGKFPKFRKNHHLKMIHNDPSIKKKISETKRKLYEKSPELRARCAEGLARFYERNPEMRSQNSIKQWKERRGKMMASVHSEASKKKRSASARAAWTAEMREEASRRKREFWRDNPKKLRSSIRKTAEKNRNSLSWKESVSMGVSEALRSRSFAWQRGTYRSVKSGRVCRYRSSWELQRMVELDHDDLVLDWWHEALTLKYEHNGMRRYTPDFVIFRTDGITVEEVGVPNLKSSGKEEAKRLALLSLCKREGWKLSWAWHPHD